MSGSMSRRDFLQTATAAGLVAASPFSYAHSSVDETIKVGLIGCGGRGTGAAADCAAADPNIQLWAMGDVFKDKMEGSQNYLKDSLKERYKVTSDRTYLGFDAYKKVLESDIDYVILATPPCFRPIHFEAAINAGKHVFFEKPIAVDAVGVKKVMEAAKLAATKKLGVAAGTQRRHDLAYKACMERIHNGEIGEIVSMNAYWNQGGLWMNPRQESWSDLEWMMRNWLYFTWLAGDHISEQHIHNIDVCNWAMNAHPVKAISLGGRQTRTDPAYGHIFDHFATEFEYENGAKMHSYCRQQDGTASRVSEMVFGTKARTNANTRIWGGADWRWEGDRPNPYMLEHKDLIKSIREGKPINEGVQVAETTLTAIMGRAAAYSGQEVTWDQMMALETNLMPANLSFDAKLTVDPVPMPGRTPVF